MKKIIPPPPRSFHWIARHPKNVDFIDVAIVELEKPDPYAPLNLVEAKIIGEYASVAEFLGARFSRISATMFQNPNHLSLKKASDPNLRNSMYPWFYEVLEHINFQVAPFRAFMLMDIPSLKMPLARIHREFCIGNKRIPFGVRLYS